MFGEVERDRPGLISPEATRNLTGSSVAAFQIGVLGSP